MPEAQRGLSSIGKANRRLIIDGIDDLATNPKPPNSKRLINAENLRRLTVGDYRVIYGISENRKSVTVELVRSRNKGYMFLAAFALTIRAKRYSK
jgi:mRNA-degrading endonuclease RelE of RelBE toxin-antitoxin system